MTANESVWHISKLKMYDSSHAVSILYVHLPEEERIVYDQEHAEEVAERLRTDAHSSPLLAWFKINMEQNAAGDLARTLTFNQMPEFFIYEKKVGHWRLRKRTIK